MAFHCTVPPPTPTVEALVNLILLEGGALTNDAHRLAGLARQFERALREVEAHHVEQNGYKGRPEGRSKTLGIVRRGLNIDVPADALPSGGRGRE